MKTRLSRKRILLFITGLLLIAAAAAILAPRVWRRVSGEVRRQKLLRENLVLEIPDLNIREPVVEGTDNDALNMGAGHFPGTGTPGSGNYCLAGHSSTVYDCIFNDLHEAKTGMRMTLSDPSGNTFSYEVTQMFIVEPDEVWILDDMGDDRLTLVTCTDDGSQRQVVIGTFIKPGEGQSTLTSPKDTAVSAAAFFYRNFTPACGEFESTVLE